MQVSTLFLTVFCSRHVEAFPGIFAPTKASCSSYSSSLSALIYGWDGLIEEDTSSSSSLKPMNYFASEPGLTECSPEGLAAAQVLSYDPDRAGHLARLAVAFSPPERALTLDQLEHVDVICVRPDSVDISAVICEDGTCLTLSVPVKFPNNCGGGTFFQSCVLSNIDDLDKKMAGSGGEAAKQHSTMAKASGQAPKHKQPLSSSLPDWWVPVEQYDAALQKDCVTIQELLNEDEFQPDIIAVAQEALKGSRQSTSSSSHYGGSAAGGPLKVCRATVTLVGPSGICFYVQATDAQQVPTALSVAYSFGGWPMTSPDSLRAAVLGAIAAAEGE